MKVQLAPLTALSLILGCATSDTQLAARVDRLERRVADLGASPQSSKCAHVWNIDVSPNTPFPSAVAVRVAPPDLPPGDSITITEVRGTRERLEVGGLYLVRGQYTLSSADVGELALTVTATHSGEGCTNGNERGRQRIVRGTGTFEMATPMVYEGRPHVWLNAGAKAPPGVYFDNEGKGP